MFRPYMWAIFRLRSNFSGVAIQDVWGAFWGIGGWVVAGWGGGEISFVSIVGTKGIGGITGGLSLVFFVHVSKRVSILMPRTCY